MPSSNDSLVISNKPRDKKAYRPSYHAAAMLLFYILQSCMLSEDLLLYIISGPYSLLSGAGVAPISQVDTSAMFVLPIVRN
jgi:hypothetical protein